MTRDTMPPTMTIKLATSDFGTPRPRIELRLPRETPWRHAKAELHQVAAALELATPAGELWSVHIVDSSDHHRPGGRVELELADGTDAEAARAMAMLERLVSQLGDGRRS